MMAREMLKEAWNELQTSSQDQAKAPQKQTYSGSRDTKLSSLWSVFVEC